MNRFLVALAAFALPCAAQAQDLSAAEAAAIDTAVRAELAASGVPSAQIAVVRDGRLVLDKAWGKASNTIAQTRTDLPYQIASNSKQFLAALILLLEDDGKLSISDPVAKWIPGISGGDKITIRQLLSHTSGLQDYWPQDYSFPAMEQPTTPQGIIDRWAKKPLDYAPGTRWQYSNTGYVVAGMIAEKAGGAPLWDQLEARLFKPLGIKPLPIEETNGAAFPQGYHRNALGPVRAATPAAKGWLWAAGELSMTAAELAEWNIARIERTLLPKEDWETMETPIRLADGTSSGYGLGVSKHLVGGRWVVDHGGESVGFLSQSSIWVGDRTAIVVLTNGDFAGVQDSLTSKIAEVVLPVSGQANTAETARTADARTTVQAIAMGKFDGARFTPNAQYYFKPETLGDYRTSLSQLGPLTAITPLRDPRLRGGFVNRNFRLSFGKKTLILISYAEPGASGRWEQFMVMPE
jgi:D-alanyl-D-alanine carboxypeptidase